jgi:hypothetical protein
MICAGPDPPHPEAARQAAGFAGQPAAGGEKSGSQQVQTGKSLSFASPVPYRLIPFCHFTAERSGADFSHIFSAESDFPRNFPLNFFGKRFFETFLWGKYPRKFPRNFPWKKYTKVGHR